MMKKYWKQKKLCFIVLVAPKNVIKTGQPHAVQRLKAYMQRHQTNGLECNEVLSETALKSGMRQKFYILELREMQRAIFASWLTFRPWR
jgi:hypothetical protein